MKTMSKQVLARWLRLAFPTYIIILFTLSMYIYLGAGPAFYNVINYNIISPLKEYWWVIVLFVQNLLPHQYLPGLYWVQFIANDLQFYILIMMPSVYLYLQGKTRFRRVLVLSYLSLIIACSVLYLFFVTMFNNFPSVINPNDNNMYNAIFRSPFASMGYYSLGIMLSIFYFEYSQAISNRDLRKNNAYIFLNYLGRKKSR